MKRSLLLLLALALSLVALALPISHAAAAFSSVAGRIIVLDPGHGGSDYGSTECAALPEKTANLQIANLLAGLLKNDGSTVYLTRTSDDQDPSNTDRATFANNQKAQVLLSIHLNGSTNHAVDGTLGLWGKRNKDLAFTQVMHSQMPSLLGVPDQGVTNFASGVLLKSNMPATIAESVYISNTDECSALVAGTRQPQIAQALYSGLVSWFNTH